MSMEELHKKLDQVDVEAVKSNSKVQEILASSKTRFKVLKYGTIELKIRAVLPRKLRHELYELESRKDNLSMEEIEDVTYHVLASMCIEEPFNNPDTWRVIDDEDGVAMEILNDIYKEALSTETDLKKFRRE